MDEMTIRTPFMRKILSRIISRELKKNLGCDVKVNIRFIQASTMDKTVRIHLDIDGEMNAEDLGTLISQVV